MIEREDLFEPAKPYARFFEDARGHIAQTHTRPIAGLGFGRIGFRITASVTDASGATRRDAHGLQILAAPDGSNDSHTLVIQADAETDIAAELLAAQKLMAAKACTAFELWRIAQQMPVTHVDPVPTLTGTPVEGTYTWPPEPPAEAPEADPAQVEMDFAAADSGAPEAVAVEAEGEADVPAEQ